MYILTPHRRGAGYFLDNQALGARERKEADVQQCAHCSCVILMQAWKQDGNWCNRCMAPVCLLCGDRMEFYGCEPALRKLEEAFNLGEKLAQFRRIAGLDAPPAPAAVVGVQQRGGVE